MTAIAGIIRCDQAPVDRGTLDRMVNQLAIYGRDAQHTQIGEGAGFLRTLLRITPEDSLDRQPLVHPPTQTVLLFDGRLDNREELAEALGIAKPDLKMMADSDVALQACLTWDTAAVDRLLGDFALAFWNPRQRRLWLARDALGTRPLYWHKASTFFAFSSMPKGLFVIPGIQRAICEERLHDYLCLLPMIGPESFFKDVYRVEPGQFLVLDGQTVRTQRYHAWDPEKELRLASDDEYLEAFREQVDRAVACRLRSTGLVASHLSSGFDSSTVTAVAARLLAEQGKPLIAYTAVPREVVNGKNVPPGYHANEGPGASALAIKFSNIEHHLVSTPSVSTLDQIRIDSIIFDIPPLNPTNRIWVYQIDSLASKRDVKVLLTGACGNFSISNTGEELLPSLLSAGKFIDWWREARLYRGANGEPSLKSAIMKSLWPILPQLFWRLKLQLKGSHYTGLFDYSPINPTFVGQIANNQRIRSSGWDLSYQPSKDGRKKRITEISRIDSGDYQLASNTLGIERRDPTADRRLIELCLSLPDSQYLRNGENRWILRRMMRNVLPPNILYSRTKGYQAPDWYIEVDSSITDIHNELLILNQDGVSKFIDIPKLVSLTENWPKQGYGSKKVRFNYRLMLLRGLSIGCYLRNISSWNG